MISVGSDATLDKGEDHGSSYAHNRQFPGAGGGAVDVAHTSVTSPAHTRRLRHRPGGSSVSALSEDQARSVGGNGMEAMVITSATSVWSSDTSPSNGVVYQMV